MRRAFFIGSLPAVQLACAGKMSVDVRLCLALLALPACSAGAAKPGEPMQAEREPLGVPAGPVNLAAALHTTADAATALRGLVLGEHVLLSCPCLERPLLVTIDKGRFGIDGLPAGRYTAEVRRSSGTDLCYADLRPNGRAVLFHGFLIEEVTVEEVPEGGLGRRTTHISYPCAFFDMGGERPSFLARDFDELWRP